jgi:DNA recombination protein RmuC
MDIIFLFIGIGVGAGIGWFSAKSKYKQNIPAGSDSIESLMIQLKEISLETARAKEGKLLLEKSLMESKEELSSERKKSEELTKQVTQAVTDNKNISVRFGEQKIEMEEMNKRLTSEFQNIANSILDEKTKKFTEQNKSNLDQLLSPLKTQIQDFSKKVEDTYNKESRESFSLKEEVRKLQEQNIRISDEANNLTKALKGDTKKQGNWGEVVLEKILERSGLEKDREYKVQVVTQNADGDTIKPDFIVYLPDDKHIIIDSKVSLTAYEALVNSESDEEKEKFKKDHVLSLRNHIKLLGEKNYQSAEVFDSPELVLMFVPIESSFGMAIQADQDLWDFAWQKKIVIVSPSTLLATLVTIASIWKHEKQTRNAMEIAKQGGALYDKFVGFVEDLIKVGNSIKTSQQSYEDAMKKLSTGSGNLVKRVDDIKKLGAKASKNLPQGLLDRTEEE